MKQRYASPRPRWQTLVAIVVALSVGGGLLWTMRSAFRVGEDMMKSVEESRPPPQQRSRSGPSLRARSEAEEAATRAKREAQLATRRVRGIVVDSAGNVVPDALVELRACDADGSASVRGSAHSAADGSFEIECLCENECEARAYSGNAFASARVEIGLPATAELRLQLRPR